MKKISFFLFLLLPFISSAQKVEECASGKIHKRLVENNPDYAQIIIDNNNQIRNLEKSVARNKSNTVYEIPVVVHIVHTGQAVGTGANISMTQINSAITRLNDRYRNTHSSSVDTKIQFVLAARDPNGNATTGVIRVNGSSVSKYASEGITAGEGKGADEDSIKSLSKWPNTDYYNIWVVTEIEDNNGLFGIQGYAYFPGASSAVDGTVIMHTCFGTSGTVNSFNNQGRTLVHELGHGLNLHHTFNGDSDGTVCPSGNGDFVADTDPHIRASSNCPTGNNTCTGSSIDEVSANFMNYSSQTCAVKFTAGQSTRMRAAILASRPSLTSSLGGTPPGASVINATCSPTTGTVSNGFGIGILEVELNNIKVVSGNTNSEGGTGYIDRTSLQQVNVDPGSSYTINVRTGNSNNEDVMVFIDYNNNGNFTDPGETVLTSNSAKTHSGTIAIPSSGVVTGTPLRMRVISDFHGNTISGSCYNPAFGQTEDFALLIGSGSSPLTGSASASNVSCNGRTDGSASATASGGVAPYLFLWSNGSTTQNVNQLSAGTYTLTISDANGDNVTSTVSISEPTAISATVTTSSETCVRRDGSASIAASGGTAPYSYRWSNSKTTSSIVNVPGANYLVTLTDANGCTSVNAANISDDCTASVALRLHGYYCGVSGYDPRNAKFFFARDPNGTNYRVRVNGSGVSNHVYTTTSNFFNLRDIPGVQYSQTYTVEIAAFINGQWSGYGPTCDITTANIAQAVNLSIHGYYCGTSGYDPINANFYFNTRSDASSYSIRVNGPGVSNVVITTTGNRFNLRDIAGVQYGQSYTVEVAATISGQLSNYGNSCTITTGTIANVVSLTIHGYYCGTSGYNATNAHFYFNTRSDASSYRARVNGPGVSNFVYTPSINRVSLKDVPGMQNGQSYTIEIAAMVGGTLSNFGPTCTITTDPTPSPSARFKSTNPLSSGIAQSSKLVQVYPNPSSQETIFVKYEPINSDQTGLVELEVYDIKGQRMISKKLSVVNGIVTTDLNSNGLMSAGIYVMTLRDGATLITKKLIVK